MLRILLADDHAVVRRGLKELLEEHVGWTVCAEAATGSAAVELAAQHRPHVAVLDISMPELNGLEATRRIRQAVPDTEVLVFTMHESEELIREVLAALGVKTVETHRSTVMRKLDLNSLPDLVRFAIRTQIIQP